MLAASTVTAVLLGAGSGQRVGTGTPKQFLALAGEPMLIHSLRTLQDSAGIDCIVVALPEDQAHWPNEIDAFGKVVATVAGAETRQGSLARALERLPEETSVVVVHDAARPMLTVRLVESLLAALATDCDGVIPAIPLEDTVKRVSADMFVADQVEREGIWRVQTPQVLRRRALEEALAEATAGEIEATDCSHLLTRTGRKVRVVPGDPQNFKVTHPGDLALAEAVLARRVSREGAAGR